MKLFVILSYVFVICPPDVEDILPIISHLLIIAFSKQFEF